MKKLMITAIAITLGMAANAATYKWNASNTMFLSGGTPLAGGTAYFFDATAYADVSADIMGNLSNALGSGAVSSGTVSLSGDGLTDDGTATPYAHGYLIIVDSAQEKYFSTSTVDVQITSAITGGGEASFAFGFQDATSAWKPMTSAPEPTSGLLLLLGMASIALKRRNI